MSTAAPVLLQALHHPHHLSHSRHHHQPGRRHLSPVFQGTPPQQHQQHYKYPPSQTSTESAAGPPAATACSAAGLRAGAKSAPPTGGEPPTVRPLPLSAVTKTSFSGSDQPLTASDAQCATSAAGSNMASMQRFCLRWNNHQTNLLSVFDQLLHDESFVDVTLAVEGQLLRAHKMVLSACSPYFKTLFVNHPDKHPIVILKDVPYADMRSLLDFMYRGEVSVDQDRLTAFLRVAECLRIKGLTEVHEEKCDSLTSSLTQQEQQQRSTQSNYSQLRLQQQQSLLQQQAQSQTARQHQQQQKQLHQQQQHQQEHQRQQNQLRVNQAIVAQQQLLNSALSQPKRKRGRPRKLSGSSTGEAEDFDSARSDTLVQGSPELLEVKMGMDGFGGNQSDSSSGEKGVRDVEYDDEEMAIGATAGNPGGVGSAASALANALASRIGDVETATTTTASPTTSNAKDRNNSHSVAGSSKENVPVIKSELDSDDEYCNDTISPTDHHSYNRLLPDLPPDVTLQLVSGVPPPPLMPLHGGQPHITVRPTESLVQPSPSTQGSVIISTEEARGIIREACKQELVEKRLSAGACTSLMSDVAPNGNMSTDNAGLHFLSEEGRLTQGESEGMDISGVAGESYERKKNELLEYVTQNDGSVICKLCGELLASRTHWYRHKYKVHVTTMINPSPLFKCSRCNVFFKSRKGYVGHTSARHGEVMEHHEELNISIKEEVVVSTEEPLPKLAPIRRKDSSVKGPEWIEQRNKEEQLVAAIIDRVKKECEAQGAAVSRRGYTRRSTVMMNSN